MSEFTKQLDKWVTEKEEIETPISSFDPSSGKISPNVERSYKDTRVIYEKIKDTINFCDDFTHVWAILDNKKYIIKCKHCPLCKHIQVGQEYIDADGHIRRRSNDSLVA